jgi:hypothetical protein
MEQSRKTTHEIVEDITTDSQDFELYADKRLDFTEFSEVFNEFAHDFIHNEELAGRKLSEAKVNKMLYDRNYLYYLWNRHMKTWHDVEIFLELWVSDQISTLK